MSACASLILITDRRLCHRPLKEVVADALEGGVDCVQLREKDLTTKELYDLARELREITRQHEALLIINDRIDVALAADADGAHLGWQSLPLEEAKKMMPAAKLIGASTHNLDEAQKAAADGADYVTFGPIFYTPSKNGLVDVTGTEAIEDVKKIVDIPLIGLGGINEANAREVMEAGADGIAVISSIIASEDPQRAAAKLKRMLDSYSNKGG